MKPLRILRTGWRRLPLGALLLAACLKDNPVIQPGNIYDANRYLIRDSLRRFDSLRISLTDGRDSGRVVYAWQGPSESLSALPLQFNGDGESLVLGIRGYIHARGYCHAERIRENRRSIILDTCLAVAPVLRIPGSILDFGEDTREKHLEIAAEGGSAAIRVLRAPEWLQVDPDSFTVSALAPRTVRILIDRTYLEPGPHAGAVFFGMGGGAGDSVRVSAFGSHARVFAVDTLDFGATLSTLTLALRMPHTRNPDWLAQLSVPWAAVAPDRSRAFRPGDSLTAQVDIDRKSMEAGIRSAVLYAVGSAGRILDSLVIRAVRLPDPPILTVTARDWDARLPVAGVELFLDGKAADAPTGADGIGRFTGVTVGPHTLMALAAGRVGAVDTFTMRASDTLLFLDMPPPAAFAPLPVDWSVPSLGNVAVADGEAVVPSQEIMGEGLVLAFPLDNPDPRLHRFLPQGNASADSVLDIYDPVEIAGTPASLFIAYPNDGRLGMIRNWKSTAQARNADAGFFPYGLLCDSPVLVAVGNTRSGKLALGRYSMEDLSPLGLDTLGDFSWDGEDYPNRGPKLAALGRAYYLVDGNGPNVRGRLIKVNRDSRKVEASLELPGAEAHDLCAHAGRIYVACKSPVGGRINVYDTTLARIDSIVTGAWTNRIAFAAAGNLSGYGFAASEAKVLVLHSLAKVPVGTLALPGGRPARSLAVDGPTGKVVVSDGDKIFMAEF